MINETPEAINTRLKDHYGSAWNGLPMYRVVWSEDQFEKRWTKYSDTGIELPQLVVQEKPKYRHYIRDRYILENLVLVDPGMSDITEKISYEPLWVFQDKAGFPLPPKWEACEFVIRLIDSVKGKSTFAKYTEGDVNSAEAQKANVEQIKESLFGNETDVGDALAYGSGVSVPSNFEKSN